MNALLTMLTALAAMMFLSPEGKAATPAEGVSAWVEEGSSRVRLVAGPRSADGAYQAGLEIRLEPGWKTYWVHPGAAGLSPHIDWSGSQNVERAEPLFPAPRRFDEGELSSIGYSGTLVLPVDIRPVDPSKPVLLKAVVEYGICEKICIPARAELTLSLPISGQTDALAAAVLAGYRGRVPSPSTLGGAGDLSIRSVTRHADRLTVELRAPAGASTVDLFAREQEIATGAPRLVEQKADLRIYEIKLRPQPTKSRLTLVAIADSGAISVPVSLDDPSLTP